MRKKPRRSLSAEEVSAVAADLALRKTLTTKMLMRKYNASRSLIENVALKSKVIVVPHETKRQNAFDANESELTVAS